MSIYYDGLAKMHTILLLVLNIIFIMYCTVPEYELKLFIICSNCNCLYLVYGLGHNTDVGLHQISITDM